MAALCNLSFSKKDRETIINRIEYYKGQGSGAKASMLLDIENNRRTEIETMHGTLLRLARDFRPAALIVLPTSYGGSIAPAISQC